MSYDTKNSGILFKNDKGGNESRPDYTGKFEDSTGKEWRLAAWIRDGRQGGKFLSIKASEPKSDRPKVEPEHQAPLDDPSDPVPF